MTTVTVLIATWNRAEFLERALVSVLAQAADPAVEVLVVDDGSTDATTALLGRYAGQIRTVRRPHEGLVSACNTGLSLARGPYLVRVDADDVIEPELLERERAVLDEQPNAVAVYTDRVEDSAAGPQAVRVREGNLFDVIACGIMMRTDAVRGCGGYRNVFWEEYDLLLRLRRWGAFVRIPLPLYRYTKHALGMTSDWRRRAAGWRELIDLWGLPLLQAAGACGELEQLVKDEGLARAAHG